MRTQLMPKLALMTLILYVFTSCGQSAKPSETPTSPKPAGASGNAPAPTPTTGASPTTANDSRFLVNVATNIAIADGSKSISLAAKAKALGKPYAVYQFSGVTCDSCKADSPKVQSDLSKFANVSRVVIFPNAIGDYSEANYQEFVNSYAPGAQRLVDGNLSVLKSIRKSKDQFFGLYIIVRASDGNALVVADDDAHLKIASIVSSLK